MSSGPDRQAGISRIEVTFEPDRAMRIQQPLNCDKTKHPVRLQGGGYKYRARGMCAITACVASFTCCWPWNSEKASEGRAEPGGFGSPPPSRPFPCYLPPDISILHTFYFSILQLWDLYPLSSNIFDVPYDAFYLIWTYPKNVTNQNYVILNVKQF